MTAAQESSQELRERSERQWRPAFERNFMALLTSLFLR